MRVRNMEESVKERIINSMFDRWSGTPDTDMESQKAMEQAIKEPNVDTIFHVTAITEARAYRAGFQDCLSMIKELFH